MDISEFLFNFALLNDKQQFIVPFEIIEIEDFTGNQAHIYSVMLTGEDCTLLEQFFNDNQQYSEELNTIAERLTVMGNNTGCRREFFRHYEGDLGDGVAVLKQGAIRLYCLYFDKTAVFFGSGGFKPPEVHAYQEVPELNAKVKQVKEIARVINNAIKNKKITVNEDGSLTINNWKDD